MSCYEYTWDSPETDQRPKIKIKSCSGIGTQTTEGRFRQTGRKLTFPICLLRSRPGFLRSVLLGTSWQKGLQPGDRNSAETIQYSGPELYLTCTASFVELVNCWQCSKLLWMMQRGRGTRKIAGCAISK